MMKYLIANLRELEYPTARERIRWAQGRHEKDLLFISRHKPTLGQIKKRKRKISLPWCILHEAGREKE